MVQDVPDDFAPAARELAVHLLGGDEAAAVAALERLGLRTRAENSDTIERASRLLVELVRARGAGESTREIGGRLADVLREDPLVTIPSHLWLLGRVAGMLLGISSQLGVRLDLASGLLPFAVDAS